MTSLARLRGTAAACLLAIALLPACKPATPSPSSAASDKPHDAAATAQKDQKDQKESSPVDAHAPRNQNEQPPTADSVMYFIYNEDGDGATTYTLEDGLDVAYWYGHEFDLGGKHYFTGFAYSSEPASSDAEVGPQTKVTLASASFALDKPGTDKPWSFVGSERYNGEFGARGNPEAIDQKRTPVGYQATDRYVLGVPVWAVESGTRLTGYALLRFIPGDLDDAEDSHWRYVGTIWTGEDNAAACDGGEVMPCISNEGRLVFKQDGSANMPEIIVTQTGTTLEAAGQPRQLGPQDKQVYVCDSSKNQYVSRSPER